MIVSFVFASFVNMQKSSHERSCFSFPCQEGGQGTESPTLWFVISFGKQNAIDSFFFVDTHHSFSTNNLNDNVTPVGRSDELIVAFQWGWRRGVKYYSLRSGSTFSGDEIRPKCLRVQLHNFFLFDTRLAGVRFFNFSTFYFKVSIPGQVCVLFVGNHR